MLPVSRAASKVFSTVHGIGGEDDTDGSAVANHLPGSGDFVRRLVDRRVIRHDDGLGGPGGQPWTTFQLARCSKLPRSVLPSGGIPAELPLKTPAAPQSVEPSIS
ncbi:MAG: hypothetical protein WCO00_09420 [Rhodospirillaceae bacterium]